MKRPALWLLAVPLFVLNAQQEQKARLLSPDKNWELRLEEDKALLMHAGSAEPVLDLSEEIGQLAARTGELVWAADSRRFAFNSRKGGKYFGCDLYELAGARWNKLPQLEENTTVRDLIDRSLRKQLKRLGAKHDSLNSVMTQWRLRRWSDNDTFEAYAVDTRRVPSRKQEDEWDYLGCSLLFVGKCDNRGGWKVISSRELSDAELEKIQAEEDGPAEAGTNR